MSKRVMILLGISFLCVLAAFFLHKHEVSTQDQEADPEPDEEEQKTEIITDVQKEDPAANGSEAGSGKTE